MKKLVTASSRAMNRRDFTNDVELGDPWIVPIPVGRGKRYAWNVRETTMPVPQFAPGATVEAKTLVSVRELPEGTPYRFAVYPRNCFGKAGEPIRSCAWTRHPAEEIPE